MFRSAPLSLALLSLLGAGLVFAAAPADPEPTPENEAGEPASGPDEALVDAPDWSLGIEQARWRDADGDGRWTVGEELTIEAELANQGPGDHMAYPEARIASPGPGLEMSGSGTLYGIMAGTTAPMAWRVTATDDALAGAESVERTFTLYPSALHCPDPGSDDPADYNCPPYAPVELTVTLHASDAPAEPVPAQLVDPSELLLSIVDVSWQDADGDGRWIVGEELRITAELANGNPEMAVGYPEARLRSDVAGLGLGGLDMNSFYGIAAKSSMPVRFHRVGTEEALGGEASREVRFTLYPSLMNCPEEGSNEQCPEWAQAEFTVTLHES